MAKPTVDFSVPLADYLATAVSDGTNSDIIETEKVDETGKEAAASQIAAYSGQLWSNRIDALFLATYGVLEGAKNYDLDTNGAVTDSETLATLSSDGDAYYVETTVVGKTSSAGEVVVAEASGVFYRAGGTVLKLAPVHTVSEVGLAGADADLVINSDDVDLTVTGVAAKVIAWTVLTRKVVELRSP